MGLFDTIMGRPGPQANSNQPIVHPSPNSAQGTSQQPQPNPNDPLRQNNPGADPNKGLPPNGQSADGKDPLISQLDQFNDLWKTPAVDPNKPVDPLTQPLLTFDPAKFATEARKMNFTQGLDPALVAKALGGDADSFMQAVNHAAQNAFVSASQLSTNLVEGAAKTNNSRLNPLLENKFKEFMLSQNKTDNPVMQHAAVAPMLDLAKRQLLAKHPEKSAAEIHQMAEQYVSDFASVFTQNQSRSKATESGGVVDPFDFSNFGA